MNCIGLYDVLTIPWVPQLTINLTLGRISQQLLDRLLKYEPYFKSRFKRKPFICYNVFCPATKSYGDMTPKSLHASELQYQKQINIHSTNVCFCYSGKCFLLGLCSFTNETDKLHDIYVQRLL